MFILKPVPHCLDYFCIVNTFEIRKCEASNFVLPLQRYFSYSGSPELPLEFYDYLVNFYKEASWNSGTDWVEPIDQLGKCCHVNDSKSSDP